MTRKSFLSLPLAGVLRSQARSKPNILFVLCDDLGWADVGCNGSRFYETPNIDRLAASGMRFTSAYTAGPVCSPTRTSIQTGKCPARVGITDYLPGDSSGKFKLKVPELVMDLPLQEVTVAEALKAGGYRTYYGGKWHLAGRAWPDDKGFTPLEQGYDVYLDRAGLKVDGSSAKRYADGCLDFIARGGRSKPFFAFVSFNEPHTPIVPREGYIKHFRDKAATLPPAPPPIRELRGLTRPRQDSADYASVIAALDERVGQLLANIPSDTIVIFTSDNGGLSTIGSGDPATPPSRTGPTCNAPLRAGKGFLYEGGIRVPLIVRAPGITRAGSRCDTPVITTDWYPTLLELAGLPPAPEQDRDGTSIVPLLRAGKLAPRTLYWHYPHYIDTSRTPHGAIREGDWKLIEFFEDGATELYRLSDDPGEKRDLAAAMPQRAEDLKQKLARWRADIGARMPAKRA